MKKRVAIVCAIAVPLLVEALLFNGAFWRSLGNASGEQARIAFSSNISEEGGVYTVLSKDDAYIDIEADAPIANFHLPLGTVSSASTNGWMGLDAGTVLISRVDFSDDGSHKPADFCSKIPSTLYVTAPHAAQSNHVRVSFFHTRDVNVSFTLDEPVSVNVAVPFFLSPFRLFVMYVLVGVVALLCPGSFLWRIPFGGSARARRICTCAMAIVFSAVLIATLSTKQAVNGAYTLEPMDLPGGAFTYDDSQYGYLAQAFASGRVDLDLPVPEWLANMENPYDAQQRGELGAQTGELSYWDYAFYDGKYYCYFGALPAAVLYLPYYLVTGGGLLSNSDAIFVLSILFSVASLFFLSALFRRFFPEKSLGAFAVSALTFACGAGMVHLCFRPSFYTVAIASGLVCVLFGVGCWLQASRERQKPGKPLLVAGALCVAASLFCRPSLVLSALLALPIFWTQIKEERVFFSKKGLGNTCCALVPFVLVGALAMAYNAVRFGSPLDFGFTHNLTGYDASEQTPFNLAATLLAAALFAFVPFIFMREYPFFRAITTGHNVLASSLIPKTGVVVEPFFCGLFFATPLALSSLLLFCKKTRAQLREREGLKLVVCLLLVGAVLLLLDTQVAVTERYLADFSWLFIAAALLCALAFSSAPRTAKAQLRWKRLFVFLAVAGVLVTALTLDATHHYDPWIDTNPGLHFTLDSWYLALRDLL